MDPTPEIIQPTTEGAEVHSAPKGSSARPAATAPQKRVSPSELVASLIDSSSEADMDRAVDEAMRDLDAAEFAGADVPAPNPTEPQSGALLSGRVANIGSQDVLIDFGGKNLGVMPRGEFERDEAYAVGDAIEVVVTGQEARGGLLAVSHRKAKQAKLLRDMKIGMVVEGVVKGMNKGGLEVDIHGLRGFIPASQVDIQFVKDISDLIGQTIRAEITKFDLNDENIVLSRRKVLQLESEQKKAQAFLELQIGQVRRGTVRSLTEFGAFVDIGGVDGLLHVSDMSWGRVGKPEEVVKVGDEIEAKIIKLNKETQKISLSLRQMVAHPWETASQKYTPGVKLKGRVVRIQNFGAFVELEPGIDGLLPVSEMSWTKRVNNPADVVKEGDVVEVCILGVDQEKRRITLSLKQITEDPWTLTTQKYAVDSMVRGKVVRTTDFGAFVELEDGIDGLIHISELSVQRVKAVTDKVKPGQEVEVRVLGVDPEAKRISLSLKPPPREPTPEELAQREKECQAAEKKRAKSHSRRGGLTIEWDVGLGGLDPSKFGR